jgi:hypothetical protein
LTEIRKTQETEAGLTFEVVFIHKPKYLSPVICLQNSTDPNSASVNTTREALITQNYSTMLSVKSRVRDEAADFRSRVS